LTNNSSILNYGFPIKAFGNDAYQTKRIINKLVPVNQLSSYFAEGLFFYLATLLRYII